MCGRPRPPDSLRHDLTPRNCSLRSHFRGGPEDPSDVVPVRAHAAGGPCRRRGPEPPAAGPGGLHPPHRPRHLHAGCRSGCACCATWRRSSARRWTPSAPRSCQFPALLPREPYEATGRWTEYGDGIFRLKDRKGADYLLGPTHEEMFTLVVKDLYSSYKDLPVWLYQIQTKYRDEARPRAGAAARPRVRDEGLLLLRRPRRGPGAVLRTRTARPTSRPSTGSASTT